MDIEKLIKMANQIGDFFEAYPDDESAKKGIAAHLKRYWNSVMIKSLVAYVQAGGNVSNKNTTLHPRVFEAVEEYVA